MNNFRTILAIGTALVTISCGAQYPEYENQYSQESEYGYGNESNYADSGYNQNYGNNQAQNVAYSNNQNIQANQGASSNGKLMDRQHNMAAFSLNVPSGYQIQGGVYWENAIGLYLPNCQAMISNASKKSSVQYLPSSHFKHMMGPAGSEGTPVADIQTTVQQVVFPRIQQQRGQINITSSRNVPDLERNLWLAQVKPNSNKAGYMASYTYQQNGETYKAELYALRFVNQQHSQTGYGQMVYTMWGLGNVFEISAPASTFEQMRNELIGIATSATANPQWEQLVRQIDAQKAREIDQRTAISAQNHQNRMQANQQAFNKTQQAYRETQNAYDNANASWLNNQRANDAGHSNSVNAIHGYENWTDPNTGTQYQLDNPNQYNWTNGDGTVISTDDAFFNPEQNGTGTYYQLDPQ